MKNDRIYCIRLQTLFSNLFPCVGYVLIVLFALFLVLQIVCKIGMMWIYMYLDLFKLFAFVNDKINLNLNLPLF